MAASISDAGLITQQEIGEENPMTKRQMAFGVICFLVGLLVGMGIAGILDVLVRLVIIVVILLLCVYLLLPSLRRTWARRGPAQRAPQRRMQRRP